MFYNINGYLLCINEQLKEVSREAWALFSISQACLPVHGNDKTRQTGCNK